MRDGRRATGATRETRTTASDTTTSYYCPMETTNASTNAMTSEAKGATGTSRTRRIRNIIRTYNGRSDAAKSPISATAKGLSRNANGDHANALKIRKRGGAHKAGRPGINGASFTNGYYVSRLNADGGTPRNGISFSYGRDGISTTDDGRERDFKNSFITSNLRLTSSRTRIATHGMRGCATPSRRTRTR